jgi:hypothetical protein
MQLLSYPPRVPSSHFLSLMSDAPYHMHKISCIPTTLERAI